MHRRFLTMENMSRLLQFSSHLVTGRWLGSSKCLFCGIVVKNPLFPAYLRQWDYILYSVISHFIICLPSTNAVMYRDICTVPTKKYRTQKSSQESEKDCASITRASAARDAKKTFLLPNLTRQTDQTSLCVTNSAGEGEGGQTLQ